MYKKIILFLLLTTLTSSLLHAGETITLGTTTSTRNTGILEHLMPLFKQATGIDVQVIAVDTGAVLKLGQAGQVDVVLSHDEDIEKQLVEKGYFIDREEIMYNDYVLLGPVNDPAGVQATKTATDAFKKIRSAETAFVSRGDNSDTNMRENRIWAMTGAMPERRNTWYFAMEMGMAECIQIATEKQAYILADRTSWYSMEDRDASGLTVVLEGDPTLFNQYGVMIVNPRNHKSINYQSAMNFVIWLTSSTGQDAISTFRDKTGNVLFTPNAR